MADRQIAGVDTMSAEDTALMDAMRNETDVSSIQTDAPDATPVDAPDPTPPEADPTDPAPADRKTVPHAALHEEREKRKAADAARQKAEQDLALFQARMNERFEMLQAAVQASTPQPTPIAAPEVPDIATDPIGHFRAMYETANKRLEEQGAIIKGWQEQQQRNREMADLQAWGSTQEVEFEKQEPTYRQAMGYLTQHRDAELTALGIADPIERRRILAQDVQDIARRTRHAGQNFASTLYNLAVSRGFQKVSPPAVDSAPAVPPLAAPATVSDAVTRAQRGREAATTIGSAGAAPPAAMTPERIAQMSDKEFAAYVDKLKAQGGNAFHQLMGA